MAFLQYFKLKIMIFIVKNKIKCFLIYDIIMVLKIKEVLLTTNSYTSETAK